MEDVENAAENFAEVRSGYDESQALQGVQRTGGSHQPGIRHKRDLLRLHGQGRIVVLKQEKTYLLETFNYGQHELQINFLREEAE